jgi:hypothetical protein
MVRSAGVEKWYCVSVRRVSYGREASGGSGGATHRLAVHDLRGAWTKLNRDLAFALIDTYIKTQVRTTRYGRLSVLLHTFKCWPNHPSRRTKECTWSRGRGEVSKTG